MSVLDYQYKTQPFPHQKQIIDESTEDEYCSLFLKPGLGKTFIIINQVGYLYERGEVDALFVIAPNGVHLNWERDEIPAHMPDRIRKQTKIHVYHSSKAKNLKATKEREDLLTHKGLAIILVAYEATITATFKQYMRRFFAKRKVFMTLDEAHRIKGRASKCKMTITAMGDHAKYRRALTGTPTEKPVDMWSIIRFLSKGYWRDKGFATAAEFDAFFCVQVDRKFGGRPSFKQIVGYRNLDVLAKLVAETGYSMTLEDAGIHLPPIIYSKRYHEMFPEQRRIYENLKNEFRHEFEDGLVVDCEAAITRLLRLQQVVCGYLGTGPGEPIRRIDPKKNPRLEMVVGDILEDLPAQCLIWSRFTQDIDQLMESLGKQAVRYDGSVDNKDRQLAKEAFQRGDAKYMVMSSAGSEGHTLLGGVTQIFYSNSYVAIRREQMEGRSWRIGQKDTVNVIDVICDGTVDNDIVLALRNKFCIQSQLTGDQFRKML